MKGCDSITSKPHRLISLFKVEREEKEKLHQYEM